MTTPPHTTPVTTVTTQYPAETVDSHLEKQIENLSNRVNEGFQGMQAELKDLRNEIRDNVSKEVFHSEVKRIDDNRMSDIRHNEAQFIKLSEAIGEVHRVIDGIKGFTWKAVTLALGVATLFFSAASFAINYFLN